MSSSFGAFQKLTRPVLQEGTKMIVQRDDHIKDLGVTFDEKLPLDFGLHVAEKPDKRLIKPTACYG